MNHQRRITETYRCGGPFLIRPEQNGQFMLNCIDTDDGESAMDLKKMKVEKNLPNLRQVENSDSKGKLDGLSYGNEGLGFFTLSEQLELEYLSDQLDIAIIENGENPRLDVSEFHVENVTDFNQRSNHRF
ncbi:hypothetical protein U1Q18_018437 [Sarracenia purpurea var. burkii]